MKQISAWKKYPGYVQGLKGYRIELNGIEMRNAIAADEEAGTVVVLCFDSRGCIRHNDDIIETEVRHGVVKIIEPRRLQDAVS